MRKKSMTPAKRKLGRPTKYTKALALKICMRLAKGESLRQICRDPALPHRSQIHRWVLEKEEFRDHYEEARNIGLDEMADELLEIADDSTQDYKKIQNRDGSEHEVFTGENVQRSRLRVDARKWLLAKLGHKKYGDRITTAYEGTITHEHMAVPEVIQLLNKALSQGAS